MKLSDVKHFGTKRAQIPNSEPEKVKSSSEEHEKALAQHGLRTRVQGQKPRQGVVVMVKLKEIRGLGSKRAELPDGSVIRYDLDEEVDRAIRGIRSACARESCRAQSEPGSRFCEQHDPASAIRKSESRGRDD